MFKKLLLSLIVAGSALSYAQESPDQKEKEALDAGKTFLRNQINNKGLTEAITTTLSVLGNKEFFYQGRFGSITPMTYKYPSDLSNQHKQQIMSAFSDIELAVFKSLTEEELNVLKNYIDRDHSDYYNDDKIIASLIETKNNYLPLYKQLFPTASKRYYVSPCYPYSDNKDNEIEVNSVYNNSDSTRTVSCNHIYGDNLDTLSSYETSTEELFYGLTLVTAITAIPGCTKYLSEETQEQVNAYSTFLTRVGKELQVIPYKASVTDFTTYAVSNVFNIDFYNHREQSRNLIASCERIQDIIQTYLQ